MNAIRDGKNNSLGCFDEYCNVVIENLERFRMNFDGVTEENPAHEILYKNVTSLLTVRNEILEIFKAILNYSPITEFIHRIHNFFERIYDYKNITKYRYEQYKVENYGIFNYQLFLYTVSLFIRYERFTELNDFLLQRFLLKDYNYNEKQNCSFVYFNLYNRDLLTQRNKQLSLRKISLLGHYLRGEWKHKTITHDEIIQAELLLSIFSRVKLSDNLSRQWFPHNIGYLGLNIPDIFIKAESKSYLNKFAVLFTIHELKEFAQQENKPIDFGMGNYYFISKYINIDKLGTLN